MEEGGREGSPTYRPQEMGEERHFAISQKTNSAHSLSDLSAIWVSYVHPNNPKHKFQEGTTEKFSIPLFAQSYN